MTRQFDGHDAAPCSNRIPSRAQGAAEPARMLRSMCPDNCRASSGSTQTIVRYGFYIFNVNRRGSLDMHSLMNATSQRRFFVRGQPMNCQYLQHAIGPCAVEINQVPDDAGLFIKNSEEQPYRDHHKGNFRQRCIKILFDNFINTRQLRYIMKYIDLISGFDICGNFEEIRQVVGKITEEMNFDKFLFGIENYRSAGGSHREIISTYPREWLEIYEKRHYLDIDPVVRHMRTSHLPLIWGSDMYQDPRQKEMMKEVDGWGLTDGLSMPLHTLDHKVGVLSLVGAGSHVMNARVSLEEIGCAQLLVGAIHEAVERISKTQAHDISEEVINLTPRERDCLQWSSIGKTSWEIGRILSISERTVNFHIYNAALKLHTYGRRHTAIRAILLGLIYP